MKVIFLKLPVLFFFFNKFYKNEIPVDLAKRKLNTKVNVAKEIVLFYNPFSNLIAKSI